MLTHKKNLFFRYFSVLGLLVFLLLQAGCGKQAGTEAFLSAVVSDKLTITAYSPDGENYYLFLPSGAAPENVKLLPGNRRLSADGKKLSELSAAAFADGGVHSLADEKNEYTLTVLSSENVPAVFITTESGTLDNIHADKDYKETGRITVFENGEITSDGDLEYIKGRGNTTWEADTDKKPYNIKLTEKAELLGMAKAKKWCLLANHFDDTLLKNTLALTFARELGLPYALDCRQADLYVNGDYRGNYLVTEKAELGENRIDKENAVLFEIDQRASEKNGDIFFVTDKNTKVALKDPDTASAEELEALRNIFTEAENSVDASAENIDFDSFAKAFLIQELFANIDVGATSCFVYVLPGENVLYAGPVWDFDNCLGIVLSDFWCTPTGQMSGNTIFNRLFLNETFRKAVNVSFSENSSLFSPDALYDNFTGSAKRNSASAVMDRCRYKTYRTSPETEKLFYENACRAAASLLKNRAYKIAGGFSGKNAMVYFHINNSVFSQKDFLSVGDTFSVPSPLSLTMGYDGSDSLYTVSMKKIGFVCWSTQPDGGGEKINAGEEITLTGNTLHLYAVTE